MMSPKEAYEARRAAIAASRGILEAAGDAELSAEQREAYEAANSDADRLAIVIEDGFKAEARAAKSAEIDALVGAQSDAGLRDEDGDTPMESEVRALLAGESRVLNLGAGEAAFRSAGTRDLLAGTATDGAELVPTTLFGQVYKSLRDGATSMFSLGRTIATPGGEQIDFPAFSSFSAASLVSEAAAIGESDPQFTTVSLNAYKYALAIQISSELEADNQVPGAMAMIVEQAVDGIRRGVGAHLVTGTGSSQPNGVDNATNAFSIAINTNPTGDQLMGAYHDVSSGYLANASWLFNDATLLAIRQLKTSDLQYIWAPGLAVGAPDTLLGKPVYTDAAVEAKGTSKKVGVFGDFDRAYLVRVAGGIEAASSTDYAFLNGLNTLRFQGRFDGEIIDNNAVTVITNAAS